MSAVLAKPQVKDFLKTLAKGKEKGQEQRKEHDVNAHATTAEGEPSKKPWEEDIPELSSPSYSPPTSFSYFSDSSSSSNPRRQEKRKEVDDPWESFFKQLEKDLENDKDDSSDTDITEDVANFEKELDTLLQDIESVSADDSKTNESNDILGTDGKDDNECVLVDDKEGINAIQHGDLDQDGGLGKVGKGTIDREEEAEFQLADYTDEDLSDEDFEELRIVNLQKWQVRKLASAIELGRRKVNIKNLAAELKLDRDDVIFFLKNPPPELLMAVSLIQENADEDNKLVTDEAEVDADFGTMDGSVTALLNDDLHMQKARETQKPTYGPRDWYKGKRIKKTNLMTLQRVYKRTRRPTNTMIESLVQVTHLPRARILQWFEEERVRSGVGRPHSLGKMHCQGSSGKSLWPAPLRDCSRNLPMELLFTKQ
ncbi:hypothetical protein L7F22_041665 [Adiantum nelumboides]|nr:hypothetical protein [Adiantum nelumboides]